MMVGKVFCNHPYLGMMVEKVFWASHTFYLGIFGNMIPRWYRNQMIFRYLIRIGRKSRRARSRLHATHTGLLVCSYSGEASHAQGWAARMPSRNPKLGIAACCSQPARKSRGSCVCVWPNRKYLYRDKVKEVYRALYIT